MGEGEGGVPLEEEEEVKGQYAGDDDAGKVTLQ